MPTPMWLEFGIFDGMPVRAAFSKRGVDARTHWREMAADLGFEHVAQLEQVHGNRVVRVERETDEPYPAADALTTKVRGLALLVRVADCASVYLFDPANRAIGLAHAGWRGLVSEVIGNTVKTMVGEFGTEPADILAAVGPSLGPCCARFTDPRREIPPDYHGFITDGGTVDLWGIARHELLAAGVGEKNTEQVRRCTRCGGPDFSSHRRNDEERMGAFLGLG